MNLLEHHDLGYTDVFVFENYCINQIKTGVTIVDAHYYVLKGMIDKHFSDRNMVYISNRVNSYNVDPLIHLKVSTIENLVGLCVVVNTQSRYRTAYFEKRFSSKPFKVCSSIREAVLWTPVLIENADFGYKPDSK